MLTISKRQIEEFNKEFNKAFIDKVLQLLIKDFSQGKSKNLANEDEMKLFIKRSIDKAGYYGITKENSVTAYIVLSFLNGENFLDTSDFKVYKHYLKKNFYDPNKYIFEIPNKNAP